MNLIAMYKKNLGLSLLTTNIILFLIFLVVIDPFKIINRTFQSAPKLLNLKLQEIKEIQIRFPDKKIQYTIYISEKQKKDYKKDDLKEFINNLQGKVKIESNTIEEYELDLDNFKSFLETFLELKKYYYLPENNENKSIAGINEQSSIVKFILKNQQEIQLKVGATSIRNNSSYVLLNNDDKIYQVEGNLKLRAGYEDKYYFRNHKILNLEKTKIERLVLLSKNQRFVYAKAGNDWQLLEPKPAKIQYSSLEGILDEIINLKANRFLTQNEQEKEWEKFDLTMEIYVTETLQNANKLTLEIMGKKDYVKYLVKYNNNFYEVSAYRIEDLIEPEKLIEKINQ